MLGSGGSFCGVMWRLANRKEKVHRLPLPSFRCLLLSGRLCLSSSSRATVCSDPPPSPPAAPAGFMVEYLVSAAGLSRAAAMKASKYLAHLKSTRKPAAVIGLMRQEGLGDDQIRRLVACHPTVLVADAKRTLEPKIRALLEAGFSGPELAQLISSSGVAMPLRSVLRRVEFWRNLLGNNRNLLKALNKNSSLLRLRLEERVIPTLSFLRSLGVSDVEIGMIVMRSRCLVNSSLERIKAYVAEVNDLGIPPGSRAFVVALYSISDCSKSTLDAKFKHLRSFGWSQDELLLSFRGFPNVINISQKKIQIAMDFWQKEAGCSLSYIARRPVLLALSMGRRLMPRLHVVRSLKVRGLPGGDHGLYNVMLLPEKKFVDKYIIPNLEKVPDLLKAYNAARTKGISR